MKFYNHYWASNYDELITYYPRFYREVLEMRAILGAHGGICDELEGNIEQAYLNTFLDEMDDSALSDLEDFMRLPRDRTKSIEERRQRLRPYFVGFGKVSATLIEEMIAAYTGAGAKSRFERYDLEGNHALFIDIERGEKPYFDLNEIMDFVNRKVPAHILVQPAMEYSPVVPASLYAASYLRIGETMTIKARE